ncbi:unnamed protein product [Phytophthora fragariaefolia]|uniref:Unnamed protein product n=1 Tax=Phytophthora fragariaefolia TaxID=1490495 RepID=A0A9W7D6F0_9STRA|nr:unnamed protein product [Phytophthora fragariaefolia]
MNLSEPLQFFVARIRLGSESGPRSCIFAESYIRRSDDDGNGFTTWEFSSKKSLAAPPMVRSISDLIGALSAFYKFAKHFYSDVVDTIEAPHQSNTHEQGKRRRHVSFMETLDRVHYADAKAVTTHWISWTDLFSMEVPPTNIDQIDDVDYNHVKCWSQLTFSAKFSLPDTFRGFRGQTNEAPRPNKDLYELQHTPHSDIIPTVDA